MDVVDDILEKVKNLKKDLDQAIWLTNAQEGYIKEQYARIKELEKQVTDMGGHL